MRHELAIGMGDALRLVDENAQNPAAAAAQELDVDHFQTFAGRHAPRDFLHLFHYRCPFRHVIRAQQ